MGIHKGTKLTDNPKSTTFNVRLDAETAKKLDAVSATEQVSKSEVIRRGIELQYAALSNEE